MPRPASSIEPGGQPEDVPDVTEDHAVRSLDFRNGRWFSCRLLSLRSGPWAVLMQLPDLTMCGAHHAAPLALAQSGADERPQRGGDSWLQATTREAAHGLPGDRRDRRRGRVIAAKLAADGFDVAVANVGSIDLADATVNEIKEHGGTGRHSRRTSPTRKRVVAGTRVREPIAQRRRRRPRRDSRRVGQPDQPDRDLPIQASHPAQRYLADPGGGSSKPA